MSLETFLEGARVELATDLGIEVVDGFIEGPLENIPEAGYGCVWPDNTQELFEDVMFEEIRIRIRVFLPITQQFTSETPADSSDLIELRSRIIQALREKQTNQMGVWFFRPESFDFDPRVRFVECVLVGRQQNEFTWGA